MSSLLPQHFSILNSLLQCISVQKSRRARDSCWTTWVSGTQVEALPWTLLPWHQLRYPLNEDYWVTGLLHSHHLTIVEGITGLPQLISSPISILWTPSPLERALSHLFFRFLINSLDFYNLPLFIRDCTHPCFSSVCMSTLRLPPQHRFLENHRISRPSLTLSLGEDNNSGFGFGGGLSGDRGGLRKSIWFWEKGFIKGILSVVVDSFEHVVWGDTTLAVIRERTVL